MSYIKNVVINPTPVGRDAFLRFRVSEPFSLFESKTLHSKRTTQWAESIFATATSVHSAPESRVRMNTVASGDTVIRQTYARWPYQAGKSQQAFYTFVAPPRTSVTIVVGSVEVSNAANFTPQNGIFYHQVGTTKALSIAKNGSITENTTQANWNVDPLNGSGPSGLTLNTSKNVIMMFDYEWLGVGTVRAFFQIDGNLVEAHRFYHANNTAGVYMSTPNLPCCYAIKQLGATAGYLDEICCAISAEGGRQKTGLTYTQHTTSALTVAAGTWETLIGLRHKPGYEDIRIDLDSVSALITSAAKDGLLGIYLRPTVAGSPTWNNTGESTQTAIYNNTISGGIKLWSTTLSSQLATTLDVDLRPYMGQHLNATYDTLWLCGYGIGSNVNMWATMNWNEE